MWTPWVKKSELLEVRKKFGAQLVDILGKLDRLESHPTPAQSH